MKSILPFIVLGLSTGSLYGLAGVGLVLTYRTSGVFNFAHGTVAAAAAFVFYTLHVEHGVPWPLAGALTVIVFGASGLIMEPLTRTMTAASPIAVVILSVGMILAIEGALFLIYGDVTRNFPTFLPQTGFHIAGVLVSWDKVISFVVALGAAMGMWLFLRTSRLGANMRAVVDNPTLVGLTGVNPRSVARTAWIGGSAFAAISGVLLAPTLGLDATLLTLLVVQSFGACAVGTFKNLPMTFVGGLIVGVAASLATKYLTGPPWSGLPSATPFLILIAVLLVVPAKRFPRPRTGTRSLVPERHRPPSPLNAVGVLAVLASMVIVPFVVGSYLPVWMGALTYFAVFGSLALLVWTSGQISLCHFAFVAFGATTLSHLVSAGIPWLLALLLAGLLTAPVGALIAIPAIRVSGIYLGLITLGFNILMQDVVYPSVLMFGSRTYVTTGRPRLGILHGTVDRTYYLEVLAIVGVIALGLWWLNRGQLGRLLRAMAETPTMLSTNGLNVALTKLVVFCLSALVAGIAGGLDVTQYGSISGDSFGPVQSLLLIGVLGVAGTGLLRSAAVAAFLYQVLPGYLHGLDQDHETLYFGLAAIVAGLVFANRALLAEWFSRSAAGGVERRLHGPARARFGADGFILPSRMSTVPSSGSREDDQPAESDLEMVP